jgi:hypothetical protein
LTREPSHTPHRCPHAARSARRSRTAALALFVLLLLLAALAPAAEAAAPLSWGGPVVADSSGHAPSAVACPSEALCVGADRGGNVLTSTDPTAPAPSWSTGPVDSGQQLNSLACAPGGPCVAVDGEGGMLASAAPAFGAAGWLPRAPIDGHTSLTGVACPSASLCLAVDAAGNVLASTDPGAVGSSWPAAPIDTGHVLEGISCAGPSLCVAIDDAGNVLASAAPAAGKGAWRVRALAAGALRAVSCSAAGYCVAFDAAGDAFASQDPVAAAPTWSSTAVDLAGSPSAISCAASGLCVGVDDNGRAFAADNPTAPVPLWGESAPETAIGLAGVSCMADGICIALDTLGRSLSARVPPPLVAPATPAEVKDTSATLSGVVDPRDAVLTGCTFEYGSSTAYGHAATCSAGASPAGGAQPVSAPITGLLPNSTYHFRLLASSAVGLGVSADAAFTTPPSSQIALVYPHPSISGTPAQGQRLTCRPGTPAGASAALAYAWLRDLIPIPGASGSSYQVKGTDTGRHLQCQVTATDGGGSATARSAFVTIPVQGAQASAGETQIGAAHFARGRLSLSVSCSALASSGCRIRARLTLVETLQGRRIVAIVATRPQRNPRRSGRAAAVRRVTVTLASAGALIAPGGRNVLTLVLTRSAARLLASRHRLPALLSVSGTVIGVIEASLARRSLLLEATPARRARHVAAARR